MEGTRSQELARKLRDKGQFSNEAAVGELYTQVLQDGGDAESEPIYPVAKRRFFLYTE